MSTALKLYDVMDDVMTLLLYATVTCDIMMRTQYIFILLKAISNR